MTALEPTIDRLATLEPTAFPVVSAYLDLRPGAEGYDGVEAFLKTALRRKSQRWEEGSEERKSLEADSERILALFDRKTGRFPKAEGSSVAIFASSGADLFEVVEFDAPLESRSLQIGHRPNLFQLSWTDDRYARYAVLLLDSQTARIFVFGLGDRVGGESMENDALGKTKAGGWSQSRYQRRRRQLRKEHVAEAVEELGKIVKSTGAERLVLAGQERLTSLAKDELTQQQEEMLAGVISLDIDAPKDEVLSETLETFRRNDTDEDEERVSELLNEFRADGLAVVGVEETMQALLKHQVEELLVSAPAVKLDVGELKDRTVEQTVPGDADEMKKTTLQMSVGDAIVRDAQATGAEVRFIEKDDRLAEFGGVGAFLRYAL